jgi:hypothetical protein
LGAEKGPLNSEAHRVFEEIKALLQRCNAKGSIMSQLEKLCADLGITCESKYGGEVPSNFANAHPYLVTLHFKRRMLVVPFYMGSAHTVEPTSADVLYCLCSDTRAGELSFDEFCSEFGYDSDSRKAEAEWKACAAVAPRVRRFLGETFDDVANAEH